MIRAGVLTMLTPWKHDRSLWNTEVQVYLKEGNFADAGVFFSCSVLDGHLTIVLNPALPI